jgi:hypothetical protein
MANDVFVVKDHFKVWFNTPAPNTLIWSVGLWDSGALWDTSPTSNAWRNLNCEAYDVHIEHGVEIQSGIFVQPGGSTAIIKMQGPDYDPFSSGVIHAGTLVKIEIQPLPDSSPGTLTQIFFGQVESFTSTYDQKGNNIITIRAVDYMVKWLNAKIATYNIPGTTLPSSILDGTWTDNANGITYLNTVADFANIAATSYTNTTLGQITQDCLTASLGALYMDRAGYVHYLSDGDMAGLISSYTYYFSTAHSTAAEHICMTGLQMQADSRDFPNVITETYAGGAELTLKNQDAYDVYGSIALDVTVPMGNSTDAQAWLDHLNLSTNQRRVKSLSFDAAKREGQLWGWYSADRLFTSHKVGYAINGISFADNYFVTKQIDHITPHGWDITLELWRGI